jgi:hypothetical protein
MKTYQALIEKQEATFTSTQAYGRGPSRTGSSVTVLWRKGYRVRIQFGDGFRMTVHCTEVTVG